VNEKNILDNQNISSISEDEGFMDTTTIDFNIENYKPDPIDPFEDDYRELFQKFKKGQSDELVEGKVYIGQLESMVKTTTYVTKVPMLNLGIRVLNDVKTPQLAVDSYVFDMTNEPYLFKTFDRLQKTTSLLGDRLDEMVNIDTFIDKYQHLIGRELYIKPYMYNGNMKFNVIDPKTLK